MRIAHEIVQLCEDIEKPDPDKNYRMWRVTTHDRTFSARTSPGKTKVQAIALFKTKWPHIFNVIHVGDAVDGVYTEKAKAESLIESSEEYSWFDGEDLRKIH